jgi:hypothetical protein
MLALHSKRTRGVRRARGLRRTRGEHQGRPRPSAIGRELGASEWIDYFRSIPLGGREILAAVEVVHEPPSDPLDTVWRPLQMISYDSHEDVLEFAVAGHGGGPALRYLISAPRLVSVEESSYMRLISVMDASGTETMIRLLGEAAPSTRSPQLSVPALAG